MTEFRNVQSFTLFNTVFSNKNDLIKILDDTKDLIERITRCLNGVIKIEEYIIHECNKNILVKEEYEVIHDILNEDKSFFYNMIVDIVKPTNREMINSELTIKYDLIEIKEYLRETKNGMYSYNTTFSNLDTFNLLFNLNKYNLESIYDGGSYKQIYVIAIKLLKDLVDNINYSLKFNDGQRLAMCC
jgi:hypothetical protein